jgi:iron complex outermembrane receptor protein
MVFSRSVLVCFFCCLWAGSAWAQTASIEGRVEDPMHQVVSGAKVVLIAEGGERQAKVTARNGHFRFDGLASGRYELQVEAAGFALQRQSVRLPETSPLVITLELATFVQEVVVTANLPEIAQEVDVEGRRLESEVARDTGEFLREQPAMFSVRRGSINLDPTLRGLQESQVAMFVDGTRTFAAGPARMDSDLSHLSPHAVQSIRVVKGPYALAWGSGTMSAIQLETIRPNFRPGSFRAGGRLGYNYGENGDTSDGYATAWGSGERFRFTAGHNTRVGNDYTDGRGNLVPGHYASYDTRWDFGLLVGSEATLEYSGGYQEQRDLDFPGRILDATYFKTQSHAVELDWDREGLGELYVQFFANLKSHAMNNDNKPTAQAMPGRVPPFGIDVYLPTESDTIGGRAFLARQTGALRYKVGIDFYTLDQTASRTISRRDNGAVLFEDIVWPDAQIDDFGGYGQLIYARGRTQIGGTVRLDGVSARAGEVSDFFRENTVGDLAQNETSVSAAVSISHRLTAHWLLSAGLGRSVRTANVLERYSDRFPAVKFQNAAEFLGNPALLPEKSLEWNLGTSVARNGARFGLDVFGRTIDDYITVMPDPDLPPRLPLSPPIVYRYINGKGAKFFGYELSGHAPVGAHFVGRGSLSYVWAKDSTFDEPAFGIAPLEAQVAGKVQTSDGSRWVELALTAVGEQTRVATARLEQPTEGWQRLDLRAGFALTRGIGLRTGLLNLTDAAYATHLNALNPFTMTRIAEPGRTFYVGVEYGF